MTELGERFTVERELDRNVAVKLLSADLSAALGAERGPVGRSREEPAIVG